MILVRVTKRPPGRSCTTEPGWSAALMSYIVVLLNLPAHVVSLVDVSNLDPLGPREAILALLTHLLPDVDISDPTWARLERDDFVIEFLVGAADRVESLGLRMHGGDRAMDVAKLLCEHAGWRAYEPPLVIFIAFDHNPAEGLQAWRQYRDRVITPPIAESR